MDFIDLAQARPIKNVNLNANGIRLATDRNFVAELGRRNEVPGKSVNIYLQFDGFDERTHLEIRGWDLRMFKQRGLDHCAEAGLTVTLVAAVERGLNEHELGAIIEEKLRATAEALDCADACRIDLPQAVKDLNDKAFMIGVQDFQDPYTLNVKQLMKCCVEEITPEPDKAQAASEFARVLKSGGRLGITDVTAAPDRLPPELTTLAARIACIADACPVAEYTAILAAGGLHTVRTERHDAAMIRMIDQIEARLNLLRMTAANRLDDVGLDLDAAPAVLAAARAAVTDGNLGYALLIAEKLPTVRVIYRPVRKRAHIPARPPLLASGP
nr:hypothetical protein [Actinopolymorpha pittospori]